MDEPLSQAGAELPQRTRFFGGALPSHLHSTRCAVRVTEPLKQALQAPSGSQRPASA